MNFRSLLKIASSPCLVSWVTSLCSCFPMNKKQICIIIEHPSWCLMSWLTLLSRPFLKIGLLQGRKTWCIPQKSFELKKSAQKRISTFFSLLDDKSVLVWLILVSGVGNSVWRFPLIRTMFMCGCDGTQYALACTMHRIPCIVFHLMFMCGCRVVERSAPRPHRHWAWFMSQKYLSCKHKNTFRVYKHKNTPQVNTKVQNLKQTRLIKCEVGYRDIFAK